MSAPTVVPIPPGDEAVAGEVYGRAFAEDPFVAWMYPDPRRRVARFARLMRAVLHQSRPSGRALQTPGREAVALWVTPGARAVGVGAQLRLTPEALRFGRRAPRILLALDHLDRHHPRVPHWYLFVIGSEPAHRGEGHARALIDPVLADCDRDRIPAYLESSNPANVPYYERFGFVAGDPLTRAGCPPLVPMWREPSGGGAH